MKLKHVDVLNLEILESLIVPAILLAGGIVLLQAQAIPYWQIKSGHELGVLWSLLLEGIALWLLYQPGRTYRFAGLLTSLVLVGVPLWQISQPVVKQWDALDRDSRAAIVASTAEARGRLDMRIAKLDESVEGYRKQLETITTALAAPGNDPAQQRRLSSARITVQARLASAEKDRAEKEDARTRAGSQAAGLITPMDRLRAVSDVAPSALSLILFVSVDVLCIRRISRYRHKAVPKAPPQAADSPQPQIPPASSSQATTAQAPRWSLVAAMRAAQAAAVAPFRRISTPPPELKRSNEPETVPVEMVDLPIQKRRNGVDEMTVWRLQKEIKARLDANHVSAAKWCKQEGLNPRDISLLAHHFTRLADGDETISALKLAELAARYLGQAERQGSGA